MVGIGFYDQDLIVIPFMINTSAFLTLVSALTLMAATGTEIQSTAEALTISLERLQESVTEVGSTELYPSYGTEDLKWQLRGSEDWTSGFYPGCLWMAYALSKDEVFAEWAESWTAEMEKEKNNTNTHDLGFRFMCTYGNQIRFQQSGNTERNRAIILEAAKTMALRYNKNVKALSSNWDNWEHPKAKESFPVVIDIMMNLELLYWAAENGGLPEYATMASEHAKTTWKDFIREDGGSYHVVRYNPNTGEVLDKGQLQGQGKETTWSRGHAWAIYGFVVCYRFTQDPWYLEKARIMADYFLENSPKDRIAPWDFQSNIDYRDVSASAITASALYELSVHLTEKKASKHYRREADIMLQSLSNPPWFATHKNGTNCLLDHSVQYLPINHNVDRPAIFADYYFLEAIYRKLNMLSQ